MILLRHSPGTDFTQGDRGAIAHINGKAKDSFCPQTIFRIKEFQLHIPTLATIPTSVLTVSIAELIKVLTFQPYIPLGLLTLITGMT